MRNTPKIIFDKIIGNPEKELGEFQPEKSLMAINQNQDENGNYEYGFDLHKMFYNSGDITNWFDERETGDEIFGCFYLATSLVVENSLLDEVDYFMQLVFKIPEKFRDKFQLFFEEFIRNQIGNSFKSEDGTREYTIEFNNGATPDYSEKANDDQKDFLASILITVSATDPINRFDDVKFHISFEDDNGTIQNDIVKYTSYNETRTTSSEQQTLANDPENVYWPNTTDIEFSFAIPSIKGNKFVELIDEYRNTGKVRKMTLTKENSNNPLDTFSKSVSFTQVTTNTNGIGPIIFSVLLRRIK